MNWNNPIRVPMCLLDTQDGDRLNVLFFIEYDANWPWSLVNKYF